MSILPGARVVVTAALAGALLALLAMLGCQHYESDLPGVLDLRSDGAEAPLDPRPLPATAARDGLEGWMKGAGVTGSTSIVAEDRAAWALRLFALGDGVKDEVALALGKGGALRSVVLQEEISGFDAALFACTLPIPCVDLGTLTLLPSFTVQLSGTRIEPSGLPKSREGGTAPPVDAASVDAPPALPEPTPSLDRPARGAAGAP